MLVRSESVQNIRRLIEDRRSGKGDLQERKNITERKSEQKARDYKSEGRKTADRQDRCKKRKIASSYKDRRCYSQKEPYGDNAGFNDHQLVRRIALCNEKQRHKYYR